MSTVIRVNASGYSESAARQALASLLARHPELGVPSHSSVGVVWPHPGHPPKHVAWALFAHRVG